MKTNNFKLSINPGTTYSEIVFLPLSLHFINSRFLKCLAIQAQKKKKKEKKKSFDVTNMWLLMQRRFLNLIEFNNGKYERTRNSNILNNCQYYEALIVFQDNHIYLQSCSKCRPSTNWKLYNLVQKRKNPFYRCAFKHLSNHIVRW